ncbi:hypothetical protein D4764_14G0000660 [Takifugu flavidus]|uniref:Uncharacterized protein n=1 Tax=Takifugu flavidus TaxID=433684 RepID=A0A5C6P401_9TELE|nr:hypothetical protein D4764_14G0000660 [Takifugu flavidus]
MQKRRSLLAEPGRPGAGGRWVEEGILKTKRVHLISCGAGRIWKWDPSSSDQMMNFKDCQPLSIVESEGFRELVQVLQPSYVLPSRKAIQ